MNNIYLALGISKQAVHKKIKIMSKKIEESSYLRLIIEEIRRSHPTMGVRDMYYKIEPQTMGRDCFEAFCKRENLILSKKKNCRKTTDSNGVIRFENLIEGLKLTDINQVWQSDITYIEVNGRFYYITFIIDGYSRLIVGYSVSERLFTEVTTLPALMMAIKLRNLTDSSNLIFHSDGGGQYYAKDFLSLTKALNIKNSMCLYSWENGKAERINGVIKNNYLKHRSIKNFEELTKEVARAVELYNHDKPHIGLKRLTPVEFEKTLSLQQQIKGCDVLHNIETISRGIEPQLIVKQIKKCSILPTLNNEKGHLKMKKNDQNSKINLKQNKRKTVNLI